jgi:hypothetical protein
MRLIFCIPDQHYPYQDKRAISAVMKVAQDMKPDYFINLGDALDFWQVSSFAKDPTRANTLADDMDEFKRDLDLWNSILPSKCEKVFLMGNHEARLDKFVNEKAPEIKKLVKSVDEYCLLSASGWEVVEYGDLYRIRDILFMHGRHHGKNVGQKMIQHYGTHTVHGHCHSAGLTWHRDAVKDIFSLNCGHLSDQGKQSYLYGGVASWREAFGVIYLPDDPKELPHPLLFTLDNGKCVVNGWEYWA